MHTTTPNGHTYRQQPIPMLQFTLDGGVVLPVVRDDGDDVGQLLDDLDTLIAELDAALRERDAAASRYADASRTVVLVQARMALVQAALAPSTRPGVAP